MRRTLRVPSGQRNPLRRAWALVLAAVCGILAFAIYGQAAQSSALNSEASQLQQQNQALQQQITERQQQVVEAQTPAWLQEEARKLGYVFPGEKSYLLTGPGAAQPGSGGVVAPLPTFVPSTPTAAPGAKPTARPSPTPAKFGPPSPQASPSG
jgi:cell division protein FtsB